MRKFGLIGFPLEHSFSQDYFARKFASEHLDDCIYENYPIDDIYRISRIIMDNPDLKGLNVTIPYKQQVLKFIDVIDKEASEIGAVNTIKIVWNKATFKLYGYNTDIYGFEKPLLEKFKPTIHKSALVLGTGGASKAVIYILKKYAIAYKYVSRKPVSTKILSYNDLTPELIHNYKIIINTSPVGMYPNVDQCPAIPYAAIGPDHILYDLVYNPEMTLFLRKGEEKKATFITGLPMLYIQAEKSWEIWNS